MPIHIKVARLDQLQKPGDYISGSTLGEPYIVLRDSQNVIRSYYNVCRHHASRLVGNGEGCLQELVCPYHGWTYTLEGKIFKLKKKLKNFLGKLRKATQIKGIEDFKPANYGLKPIEVQTFGPWVFIKIGKFFNLKNST